VRPLVVAAALATFALAATPVASGAVPAAVHHGVLDATVRQAPGPLPGTDLRRHLLYEVLLENAGGLTMRFDRLEVRDPARRRPLAAYRDEQIKRVMIDSRGVPTRTLGRGRNGALFLDVTLQPGTRVPTRLSHRFVVRLIGGGNGPRTVALKAAPTRVDRRAPLRIGPPLRGKHLGVVGCCGSVLGHRRALMEVDGRLSLAQRYAIDFVRLDEQGNSSAGDPTRNESYFIFGGEVIAVAPGLVLATRNDVPEGTPPGEPTPNLAKAAGNYVTQDLGGGRFALYAHMQPGSITVKPGDNVQRGQVIGLVGNTGQSSEPHLHFHIMNEPGGPTALAGDGLPYVFDHLRYEAHITGLEDDPPKPELVAVPPPPLRAGQYPFTGDIIGFPEAIAGRARPAHHHFLR
jgi:hypothetical protein